MTAVTDPERAVEAPASEPTPDAPTRRRAWWASALAWICALAAGVLSGSLVPMACCLAIAALALVRGDDDYVPLHAYGLAGVSDGIPPVLSTTGRTHLVAVVGGALVIVALSAAGVATAVSIAVLLVVGLITWLRAAPELVGRRHARKVRKALLKLAPTVVLPFAGRSGGPWQLGQWEPLVVESGQPAVVVNVHRKYLPMLLDGGQLSSPIVQLGSRGTADVPTLVVPSVRAMLYVQNAALNLDFLALEHVTHVWLGHGDSDKPASHSAQHHRYDLVVASGQAAIDRYQRAGVDIPARRFVVLGRPQTRGIVPATGRVDDQIEPTVLYAPTWQGVDEESDYSSLDAGPQIVQALVDRGATVVFRPHPLSYHWRRRREAIAEVRAVLRADRDLTGRPHEFGVAVDRDLSIADCVNRADAIVTDVSAVASDALASLKPYAMVAPSGSPERFREDHPVAEAAYVILGDMTNLVDALDDLLVHDPLALARDQRRHYVLGDLDGEQSSRAFGQFLGALVAAA